MPYKIRKQKCKQSDGDSGSYVLSYTDKKGKSHSNCHTSKKRAKGQIAAIEGPKESIVRLTVREMIREFAEAYSLRSTYFRNPYEDPGDEFLPDTEDPIGLQRAARKLKAEEEIRGRE